VSHEPLDAAASDLDLLPVERDPDLVGAVDLEVGVVDPTDVDP